MKHFSVIWKRHSTFFTLLVICTVFFVLRLPSLFEPQWYGDEGIYQVIGNALNNGRLLYKDIWDNKPPLLYLLYAVFNGDQFSLRLTSLLIGVGSIAACYFLAQKLFKNNNAVLLTSAICMLLLGLPVIEGNIANAENFMLLPTLSAGLIVYNYVVGRQHKINSFWTDKKALLLAGFLVSLTFLIKAVGLFDFLAFLLFLIFTRKGSSKEAISELAFFVVGFIFPIIFSLIYFSFHGLLDYYINAAFRDNVTYVGWRNFLFVPNGLLYLKILLLSFFLLIQYRLRKKDNRTTFLLLWLACALFSAFFSGRPYAHYQLVVLPSFALIAGFLFTEKKALTKLFFASILLTTGYLCYTNFLHWNPDRTIAYYMNFISFTRGAKSLEAYQAFFDPITPRDYAIASFIASQTQPFETTFLWGNSAQIYTLSQTLPPGRYAVAYHINSLPGAIAETEIALKKRKPKYIKILNDQGSIPFDLTDYQYKLTIGDTHIYEQTL